jgi:hypothetical protein
VLKDTALGLLRLFLKNSVVKTMKGHQLLQLLRLPADASLQGSRINRIRDKLAVFILQIECHDLGRYSYLIT